MKKLVCALLTVLLTVSGCATVFCEYDAAAWEAEYRRIIHQAAKKNAFSCSLADFDFDSTPELVVGNDKSLSVYTYKNLSMMAKELIAPVVFLRPLGLRLQNTAASSTRQPKKMRFRVVWLILTLTARRNWWLVTTSPFPSIPIKINP